MAIYIVTRYQENFNKIFKKRKSRRLKAAGAVLIAKLATGEMAYDDIWFGGYTKNPWNIAEGSSGSSAGRLIIIFNMGLFQKKLLSVFRNRSAESRKCLLKREI